MTNALPPSDELLRYTAGDTAYWEIRQREIAFKRGDFLTAMIALSLTVAAIEPNIFGAIKKSAFGRFFAQTSPIVAVRREAKEQKESRKQLSAINWQKTPKKGDRLAGYAVTSGYGKRPKPCPRCSEFHQAIDLGTPTGTPLYAVANTTVKCWRDAGGGGLVADYALPDGKIVQLLHLKSCKSGEAKIGALIAKSGNSGMGTGAHVDIRLKPRSVVPPTDLIERTLKPLPTGGDRGKTSQFVIPTQGTITQGLDRSKDGKTLCTNHCGVDIANAEGTPIVAVADGRVAFAGEDEFGLGLALKIEHKDSLYSIYGHNQSLLVRVGQQVKKGQTIAYMGSTGYSTGPHLHFELRVGDSQWLDPLEKMDFSPLPRAETFGR